MSTHLRQRVAELRVDVTFAREPAAKIADRARMIDADLIVKPLGRPHRIADFLHTPTDWKLMREAPCPVLFTRSSKTPRCVLAAVDLVDPAHGEVNATIVRNARDVVASLAAELRASVTVLGTAGRSGLKKLLIGHTVEAIVGDLSTDLLTVRAH